MAKKWGIPDRVDDCDVEEAAGAETGKDLCFCAFLEL